MAFSAEALGREAEDLLERTRALTPSAGELVEVQVSVVVTSGPGERETVQGRLVLQERRPLGGRRG